MTLVDTDAQTAAVHLDLLRRASTGRRLRLALSLSESVIGLSRRGIARGLPNASAEDIGLRFVELHYGAELAREVRRRLQGTE